MQEMIQYKEKVYYNPFFTGIVKILTTPILNIFRIKKIKIRGKIQEEGNCLIASHHEHYTDQFIIGKYLRKRLFWIADTTHKKSLVDTKIRKWLMMKIGCIPIDKRNPERNKNLFQYLCYILSKQESIVFFTEAYLRKERNNEKFGKFKDGIVRLALEYELRFGEKVPIYPVGINYTNGQANINIGKPMLINRIEDRKRLFEKIKELSR